MEAIIPVVEKDDEDMLEAPMMMYRGESWPRTPRLPVAPSMSALAHEADAHLLDKDACVHEASKCVDGRLGRCLDGSCCLAMRQ